jgi:hypothetical protein
MENNDAGIFSAMIDINNYLVYERCEGRVLKHLYRLIYINRSTDSPFHKEN